MKDHIALVVHNGDQVLFIQRAATKKTLPNIWAFPSGTVEAGEDLEVTAQREAKEELGIVVGIKRVIASVSLPEFDVKLHFVVCAIQSGTPTIQEPNEIQAIRWLTFKEFFDTHSDDQIGHGLIYLRKHPELWSS